ncbi:MULTISPECIES: putative quinol monooxygenase [Amycolatopsis]|uniref:Antibiotic biosynthesis monooxygenase n=1 Tax=Amycolatopsis dendrobii TaxID=2760662 RepID=A0A7W3ZDM3_9PSEU|nr:MULTISPECIES: antibiotic biosynthesis monooxygenase [Amycolatopsis]MBB1157093.1 antibiotic biosynthesis monooxygenase [Amycolatopsis dendrobii]UKD59513.1 antibiotic biosynthesis monooxygenase [Amycolatopsis sp. FU40]
MSEIVVVARLQAKLGRGAELLALFSELVPEVLRDEPDTLRYAFYVEPGSEPLRVTVVEKYPSRTALDAHNTGVLTKYLPRLLELLDGAPEPVELRPAELAFSASAADAARLSL